MLQTVQIAVPHVSAGVATSALQFYRSVRGVLCLVVASVTLARYSPTNQQALSGPAASKTLKTQFAKTATVGS